MISLSPRRAARHGGGPSGKSSAGHDQVTEFAWRVHGAQASWANNADVKASILLALEGGALYAVISALGAGGILARSGSRLYPVFAAIGISALLLAIISAAIAVFPRLGQKDRGRAGRGHGPQVIYFGALRRWNTTELVSYIAGLAEGEELDMLSQQLTEMARHNWAKHRWVQLSLILSLTGILIIAVTAATAL